MLLLDHYIVSLWTQIHASLIQSLLKMFLSREDKISCRLVAVKSSVLLKGQGVMLCPFWVEAGPFEPCGLYQFIVRLWLRLSSDITAFQRVDK